MSEELNPENELNAIASPPTVSETEHSAETPAPLTNAPQSFAPSPRKPLWQIFVAPAWFLFGVLVGLGMFAVYAQWTAKPAAPPPQALDAGQVKQAAKEGLLEAIQELQAQSSGNNQQGPQTVDPRAFAVREANRAGEPNAKVLIVEYADFQCPFCGRHHELVEPTILNEYVKTGKASLVYKHLAFLGPESVYAAVASECAADQGKFWDLYDYLFEHQNGENEGAFTKDKLVGFGKTLNLDMPRFEKCLQDDETVARVQADTAEAQQFGVSSTPTFFVNGEPLVGLKSPDEFRAAIDKALAQ